MTRLIAIDIDGTLLDGRGRVPDANLAALREAAARGIHLVVVTGRNYPFALQALAELPDPLTVVAYNGAVARVRGGATLATRPLPRATARRVLAATRPWRSSALVQFDREGSGQTVVDSMSWDQPNRRGYYAKIKHLVQAVDDLESACVEHDPVQVAFNGSTALMDTLVAVLRTEGLTSGASLSITAYPARDFTLVDINAAGATKGSALAHVAAHYDVAQAEVFAIGDNHNDVDMLQWAGTGVVMGNAEPEVLALGLPVTASHNDAGLAVAIREHVLAART
ncbi:MAG TPA: HAD family hydrolase [Vicinamibacterales bacterium]|nr:HAD family hydrolase [Vicinamibacterales bacterium]